MFKNKNLSKYLVYVFPITIILVLEVILFNSNYVSGTWLTGWDSTQPELNLSAHLSRNISAIWQEYRGLGVADGMAHAANIVHLFYVLILSLVLPPEMIRYVFVHLMHFLGGVGAYVLASYVLKERKEVVKISASFAAAVFYMLNPGTIQMFYPPFELFIIHFGFLPWMIWSLFRYLEIGDKRTLFLLFLINLAGVSQFHVPTIFLVYVMILVIVSVLYLVSQKGKSIRKLIFAGLVIFAANSFWAMPYAYSAINNTEVITNSKINVLSNEEIVLRNEAYGDFESVALLHGFNLTFEDWYSAEEKHDYQFAPWREQWNEENIKFAGLVLFTIAIVGIIFALIKLRWIEISFVGIFTLGFINLGSSIPVFGEARNLIYQFVPYYEEVFRFVFTKFIISYALAFGVLIAIAIGFLFSVSRVKFISYFSVLFALLVVTLALLINIPAFGGDFTYSELKHDVPDQYFELFNFFEDKEGRIALLPQPVFWGWEFEKWGYRGSGIVWQGMNNPILHRAFDPWSQYNETYYLELSEAVYTDDFELLENVLRKYNVSWIVFDTNIFQPQGWEGATRIEETADMLNGLESVERVFESGSLGVYKTNFGVKNFVYSPERYSVTSDSFVYSRFDPVYNRFGDYIAQEGGISYPASNLYSDRKTDFINKNDSLVLNRELGNKQRSINAMSWNEREEYIPLDVYAEYNQTDNIRLIFKSLYPKLLVEGDEVYEQNKEEAIEVSLTDAPDTIVARLNGETYFVQSQAGRQHVGTMLYSLDSENDIEFYSGSSTNSYDLSQIYYESEPVECGSRNENTTHVFEKVNIEDGVRFTTKDTVACLGNWLPAEQTEPSLFRITSHFYSVTNTSPDTCFIEEGGEDCLGTPARTMYEGGLEGLDLELFHEAEADKRYWFTIYGRAKNPEGTESISEYKNLKLEVYPLVGKLDLSTASGFMPQAEVVQLNQPRGSLNISLPLGENESLARQLINENYQGRRIAENCNTLETGEVSTEFINGQIKYTAKDGGINCDYIQVLDIKKDRGYLIHFRGENIKGRSIKFVLNNNVTRHNELEFLLGSGEFDEYYSILPRTYDRSYDLNIETRSFGGTSENVLTDIEIIPIPFHWLTSLTSESGDRLIYDNSLAISSIEKAGTHRYDIQFEGEGLLALSQGYDEGWNAYSVVSDQSSVVSSIQKYFPFLFGKKLQHVKVNGWANGWLIEDRSVDSGWSMVSGEENTIHNTPDTNHNTILIVFWPQYLEFAGFAIIGLTLIIFAIWFTKEHRTRKTKSWADNVMAE